MRRELIFPALFYLTKNPHPIDTMVSRMPRRPRLKRMQFTEHFPVPISSMEKCPCCGSYNVYLTQPKREYSFGYVLEKIDLNKTFICMECEELFKVPETILPVESGFFF